MYFGMKVIIHWDLIIRVHYKAVSAIRRFKGESKGVVSKQNV